MKNLLLVPMLWAATLAMPSFSVAQSAPAGLGRVNSLSELDLKATKVQFKNRATGQWAVLQRVPQGGGNLMGDHNPDTAPWVFYQATGAAAYNVEVKRSDHLDFNWSSYRQKTDAASSIAWNHAKRLPNIKTPAAPHAWTIEDAGGGFFRISDGSGTMELMPNLVDSLTQRAKIITRPKDLNNRYQEWEIYTDKVKTSVTYNPATTIAFNQNPFGPWDIGYGTVGGDFTKMTKFQTRGTGGFWNGNESWKGVYFNPGAADMVMGEGFVVKTGMLVMHPGNGADHLSKLRFTAPADGSYSVDVTWTAIDNGAKKTWTWVYTNAAAATGPLSTAGAKELFTKGINGFGGSASYKGTVTMKKGEVLSFEIGNGGDQYFDDALDVKLVIRQN
jgi:hypothetical protein